MKLEVGMYCYNKTNRKLGIGKIISFQRNNNVNIKYKNDIELVSVGNIEASHNIIDLIEVGDYVNGKKVLDKWDEPDWYGYFIRLEGETEVPTIRNIKSIVTKEQFDSMKYEVDSNE